MTAELDDFETQMTGALADALFGPESADGHSTTSSSAGALSCETPVASRRRRSRGQPSASRCSPGSSSVVTGSSGGTVDDEIIVCEGCMRVKGVGYSFFAIAAGVRVDVR